LTLRKNEQKYTLVNVLRIVISCISVSVGIYYDLNVVRIGFGIHFCLSVLWFVLIQFDLLIERDFIWAGFLPLTLDVFFVTYFVYFSGNSGSFAVLIYVIISALSSLEPRFNYGMFAAILGPLAYSLVCLLVIFGFAPNQNYIGIRTDATWFRFLISTLLLVVSCVLVSRIIHALIVKNAQLLFNEEEAHRRDNERSEKRYKHIVEGSSDIIFSLDSELRFVTLNRAFSTTLGHAAQDWIGRSFRELLRASEGSAIGSLLLDERLEAAKRGKKAEPFSADLTTSMGEHIELVVQLERAQFEDSDMIYGKATLTLDDALLRYFVSERQKFVLRNYLSLADQASDRVTKNLGRYADRDVIAGIRVSLREILINAIEHGNLEIDYDLKSEAMAGGDYLLFIRQRQAEPAFRDRNITVECWVNPRRVMYRITDEGKGFDHKKMVRRATDEQISNRDEHGRGIAIVLHIFDIMRYNEKGNQVILIKYFSPREA